MEATMQNSLIGKTAIITGGSRGIGRAIALAFAAQGARVVLGYVRNEASAREVVKVITDAGGHAIAVQADLSRRAWSARNEVSRSITNV
jgi:3-oxoacyl-[acyl-carrier protein] reductase